jgi:Tfp pilus assembly protein PilN
MLRADQVAALNLSRRPLVNRRPVQRAATALWVAAAVVLAIDAALVFRHTTSSSAGRDRLAEVEAQIGHEAEALQRLDRSLRGFDLEEQNHHVEFLNRKIAQRTFPWSRLFDQLGETLPPGVRLQSLRPEIEEDDTSGPRPRRAPAATVPAERWVQLQIAAEAETSEAILELVDALFRHPAFSQPILRNESRDRSSIHRFNLGVRYLPDLELPADEETASSQLTRIAEASRTAFAATGGAP